MKEGFACTLLQSKICLNGRIRADGRTALSGAMKAASGIPVVGSIFKNAAAGLDAYNEHTLRAKLRHYSSLFQFEHVSQIAYTLAARLTLD